MKLKPLVIANWKMHKTHEEAKAFIMALKNHLHPSVEVGITPSFTALESGVVAASGSSLLMGAQNVHEAPSGAFTGEISARQLSALGVSYVLLGHSERRHIFKETSKTIALKVKSAVSEGLLPVLCIGETLEERETGKTEEVLAKQLKESLEDVTLSRLVVAYEPVWAIGTGKVATPDLAEKAHHFIYTELAKHFGTEFADRVPLLYGGSVKQEHMKELLQEPHIHGVLVGGASLDVTSFGHIIRESVQ